MNAHHTALKQVFFILLVEQDGKKRKQWSWGEKGVWTRLQSQEISFMAVTLENK